MREIGARWHRPWGSCGPSATFAQWIAAGKILGEVESRTSWWIGDWWVYGEHRYGERKALVDSEDWSGPTFQTCMEAATVCRAFETFRRRKVLSFTRHKEVHGLNPTEADRLLDWCEEPLRDGGKAPRSKRELRNQVIELRRQQKIRLIASGALAWPTASLERIAVAEAGDRHWAPAKDATQLFEAIKIKLGNQASYVI